ncbi:MAG: TerC family protein [Bacteroidetes bacterium]|nr:MAG: TerC family protein [Bacteroidota bacterium]RLD48932.1 MAG: TerC family protein [Bacteroidota bacterium]RLD73916.1 MAG: TerC family protein [Bacteroidota bacterium]RLD88863.1 MAG: TerC family protein [Bacteroidota bacterium]
MSLHEIWVLLGFLVMIAFFLALDLGVFNKKDHEPGFKESLGFTIIWVSLALIFWGLIYLFGDWIHGPFDLSTSAGMAEFKKVVAEYGPPLNFDHFDPETILHKYRKGLGLEFITGYVIEYSLSIDNIFVILMIFYSFGVEKTYYHRVLFWGIIGAVMMRFIFIFISSALIHHFEWVLYLFGILLVFTGGKMFLDRNKEKKIDTSKHPVIKFLSRYFAIDKGYKGRRFFIRKQGKIYLTSLFVVLMVIEFSDVIFAVDSVPAIFSITKDPFIVYFSNIFAIIGLRSLFFLLMNVVERFRYLKIGLSVLLVFIGIKMLIHDYIPIPTIYSLLIILSILLISIFASLLIPVKEKTE